LKIEIIMLMKKM